MLIRCERKLTWTWNCQRISRFYFSYILFLTTLFQHLILLLKIHFFNIKGMKSTLTFGCMSLTSTPFLLQRKLCSYVETIYIIFWRRFYIWRVNTKLSHESIALRLFLIVAYHFLIFSSQIIFFAYAAVIAWLCCCSLMTFNIARNSLLKDFSFMFPWWHLFVCWTFSGS